MRGSIFLGKPFGISVYVHWTFSLILAWVVFSQWRSGSSFSEMLFMVLFVLLIFGCVTLHELGHALAAKHYKIQTKNITLLPIGGVANLEKMPQNPIQELVVAIAGPIVNVLIAMFLFLKINLLIGPINQTLISVQNIDANNFWIALMYANILLAAFNMIPAFPMDGGRVLRALLALKYTRIQATKWATQLGQSLAIIFGLFGLVANPFLIIIAIFIYWSARSEFKYVDTIHSIQGKSVDFLVQKDIPTFQVHEQLHAILNKVLEHPTEYFIIQKETEILGTVTRHKILRSAGQLNAESTLEKILNPVTKILTSGESLQNAYTLMLETTVDVLVVVDDHLNPGILTRQNILAFASLTGSEQKYHRPNQKGDPLTFSPS